MAALRAIPGLDMVRPGDANETAYAWQAILERPEGPKGLALTRQNLPVLEGTSADGVARGGYVLRRESGDDGPRLLIIATGSELQIAAEAHQVLEADGIPTRVVSMPCMEWFDAQDEEYRESVIPSSVRARVTVEAAVAQSWYRFLGDAGVPVSIERFGASADYQTLFREFGFTTEAVVGAAKQSLANVQACGSPPIER
jgi:transketolase